MKKLIKWIKENQEGIMILFVLFIIIVFGLTGVWDYLFKFVSAIFSGFSSGGNPDYIPGENFPYQ